MVDGAIRTAGSSAATKIHELRMMGQVSGRVGDPLGQWAIHLPKLAICRARAQPRFDTIDRVVVNVHAVGNIDSTGQVGHRPAVTADDRQMVYALDLLTGVRPGESAALRWRHYEPTVTTLGKILVAKSYNTRGNIEKTTKIDAVKHIPVHPVLAAMLAQWRRAGWPEMMGRAPGRMT